MAQAYRLQVALAGGAAILPFHDVVELTLSGRALAAREGADRVAGEDVFA